MKEILKNYIIDNYGAEMFQDIIQKNYLQYQYVEEEHNVKFLLNKANVILLQNELIRVAKKLEENDIKYIAFKGAILANRLYDNIYTRFFSDIDIFVLPEQFDKALTVLYEDGYILSYPNALSGVHHVALKKDKIVLELHRNILNPFTQIDETFLRSNLEILNLSGIDVTTFNITGTFLHLIYHLYMDTWLTHLDTYFVYSTKSLPMVNRFFARAYEIALFSEKYFDEISWKDIVSDIKKQKLRIIFNMMINDIIEIFPNAFPKHFINTVINMDYVYDERDILYEYIIDSKSSNATVENILGCRQHGISEGGKLSVIGDIGSFHLRCVFVESDIFPHRRNLFLNVCNFTAVFIREVLVGVAQILTVVFYPAEGDAVRGHF